MRTDFIIPFFSSSNPLLFFPVEVCNDDYSFQKTLQKSASCLPLFQKTLIQSIFLLKYIQATALFQVSILRFLLRNWFQTVQIQAVIPLSHLSAFRHLKTKQHTSSKSSPHFLLHHPIFFFHTTVQIHFSEIRKLPTKKELLLSWSSFLPRSSPANLRSTSEQSSTSVPLH